MEGGLRYKSMKALSLMMCCKRQIAVVLLLLFGACSARMSDYDGIGFLRKITEDTLYELRIKQLARKLDGCPCEGAEVWLIASK